MDEKFFPLFFFPAPSFLSFPREEKERAIERVLEKRMIRFRAFMYIYERNIFSFFVSFFLSRERISVDYRGGWRSLIANWLTNRYETNAREVRNLRQRCACVRACARVACHRCCPSSVFALDVPSVCTARSKAYAMRLLARGRTQCSGLIDDMPS